MGTPPKTGDFNEIPVLCDDDSWVWHFLEKSLQEIGVKSLKLKSSTPFRQTWQRFKDAPRFIIQWEGRIRSGGAIIEEILDINANFDVADRIIVITDNPMREDVVYLSELGVRRVIRVRHKESSLQEAARELSHHLSDRFSPDAKEVAWVKLQRIAETLPSDAGEKMEKVCDAAEKLLADQRPSARYLDIMAIMAAKTGEPQRAERLWLQALEINPNYFRAYNNLIQFYKGNRMHSAALDLLHRIHNLNRARISRNVDFGDVYLSMQDNSRAEQHYKRAISQDHYCSGALNGLAKIRFAQDNLEEARELLARTSLAYEFASHLNALGIEMVKQQRYTDALLHYTKAQYVIPQREKGPQLFFNIGLCYSRWGKLDMAETFLRIALAKESNYKKARDLLVRIQQHNATEANKASGNPRSRKGPPSGLPGAA